MSAPTQVPEPARPTIGETDLIARRDRLIERFTVMQADLGGLYYEMAIRDHVRDDVLRARAAQLQRVELELAHVERVLNGEHHVGHPCPACDALAGPADVFCAQCATPLVGPPRPEGPAA